METGKILIIFLEILMFVLLLLVVIELSSQGAQLNYLNEWKDSIKAYKCLNPCQFP